MLLVGKNIALGYELPKLPGTQWTTFRVPLDESAAWVNTVTGARATNAEIRSVLAALQELRIYGEFRSGSEQGFLDNVMLGAASN